MIEMMQEAELIQTITEKANIPYAELNKLIEEKELEFSGLVSRQGAILIVAKELGLDLIQHMDKSLKIANIASGMQRVNFFGKIVHISDIREFENTKINNAGGTGKVANILLGDETGTIRLSLWNEKTDVLDKINVGDVLEIINGFTKTDYKGNTEVRLSKYGNLRKANDLEIQVKKIEDTKGNHQTISLDKIHIGQLVHVKGQLVQVYDRKIIHYLCPECKKKVMGTKCETHGEIIPTKFLVLSGVVDDGTATANISFFNESVEAILGKNVDEIEKAIMYSGEKSFFSSIDALGMFLSLKCVVKENSMSGGKELGVRQVKAIDSISEINSLLNDPQVIKTEA